MINCPNCSKEIADNSAHCGFCGHEINAQVEKRTMFGMAALDDDALKKAVEEARESSQEAKSADAGGQKGLKLPTPGGKTGGGERAASEGGISLPKPGDEPRPFEEADELAATEMLEFSEAERDALINTGAAPAEESSAPPAAEGADTTPQEQPFGADLGGGSVEESASQQRESEPAAGFAQPATGEVPVPGEVPTSPGEDSLAAPPKKSNAKLFIIIGVVLLLFGGGCVATIGYFVYTNVSELSEQFGD